jgi:phosphodiesterase/alkaline phosphatase D-like protein
VSNTLTGLTPGTQYYYAAVASNSVGVVEGAVTSFTTGPHPLATTLAASGVTGTSATLNGTVDPKGVATVASFVWGVSTNFGNTNLAGNLPAEFASPGVSNTLTGLTPGTQYYYAAVASNSVGVVGGKVLSFTTAPPGNEVVREGGKPSRLRGRRMGVSSLAEGTKRIELVATPGQTYVIEAASDLSVEMWTIISTNTAAANGKITFTDPQSAGATSRYYRLRIP